jgi:hypothetical protein
MISSPGPTSVVHAETLLTVDGLSISSVPRTQIEQSAAPSKQPFYLHLKRARRIAANIEAAGAVATAQ